MRRPAVLAPDAQAEALGGWARSAHVEPLRAAGATFVRDASGELIVDIGGTRVIVYGEEVLFILREIFVAGCYDVRFDYPAVVWDIGMNRGLASLYFARMANVRAVVAYEPFRTTYEQAQDNLALNPGLARKITTLNRGVGAESGTRRTGYCPQWTGNMRVDGVPRWLAEDATVAVLEEEIEIQSARDVLAELEAFQPGLPIVAKIDCEGSEYGIVKALEQSGHLRSLKAILMEWHLQGPGDLTDALASAGFTVFSQRQHPDRGMLYAVR